MFNPISTYRIQFHKNFTLKNFYEIIPYLEKLGVKTIYASPVFCAVPGSMHGYDITHPNIINPEIGTLKELKEISYVLRAKNINWLQDIVPNHMAYHYQNTWLMDVLEKGNASEYKSFFDINFKTPVLAPFLGEDLESVLSKNELLFVQKDEGLYIKYYDNYFPLKKESQDYILKSDQNKEVAIQKANTNPQLIRQVLKEQHYELVPWQCTDKHINYRRFFTINGLICLNIQQREVFEKVHELSLSLIKDCTFNGLRIDHIDGLYDPTGYVQQLRRHSGANTYIIAEKILDESESLPGEMPLQGTTGYDFLATLNNLFTNTTSEKLFTEFYAGIINEPKTLAEKISEKKSFILYHHMAGELENLYHLFLESDLLQYNNTQDIKPSQLKKCIAGLLIQCPVYRYYPSKLPLSVAEENHIIKILERIAASTPELITVTKILKDTLVKFPKYNNPDYNKRALHFFRRCMQLSGPLMAKGVEDTLMYSYNRFIGHNEVGDSPARFGISINDFNKVMIKRANKWPLSLNATSTHDTKRGEDVRARLNVLTDLPAEWFSLVKEWQASNLSLKKNNMPDANDEYFIYQTLIGAYPMPGSNDENFKDRLREYIPKALREAKVHSTWSEPNQDYENATIDFALSLLDNKPAFGKSFHSFLLKISDHGILNSLSQLILKHTCPGLPDTYQGTELWDLSLVDPDNRTPVNYNLRQHYLKELKSLKKRKEVLNLLWQQRSNGIIKIYFLQALLRLRKKNPKLFEKGLYLPLEVKGKYKAHLLAFARRYRQTWCVVAMPLHTAQLPLHETFPEMDWGDTQIILPDEIPPECEHSLLKITQKVTPALSVNSIFKTLPFAVLKFIPKKNKRAAGILMPVNSLPSDYGIGDLGTGAKNFAGFLSRSMQKYWQLLPLNPVNGQTGYSPYSSISAMAGNNLLISPELLMQDGLLNNEELEYAKLPASDKIDYELVTENKRILFKKAYQRFKRKEFESLQKEFANFCYSNADWLDDFSLYKILKCRYEKPWYDWPKDYRNRNSHAMAELQKKEAASIDTIKWQQYIFHKQWKSFKQHCNALGIKLFGDLPFYLSHDSVEVWVNPHIFSLDNKGLIKGIAGVPPDYFSKTGQLWGMPTFNWAAMKENNYDWWIKRLRKNLQMFDVLRIDHFRALAQYWEVPAEEKTAVNGKWMNGPGKDFFNAVKKALGKLPFIAEDLGDNMEKVYKLRDAIKLPGMKVLQFAFGENHPTSVDTPHNFTTNCVVYSGTHDNNTTLGWYRSETKLEDRVRIEKYTGKKINEKNINEVIICLAYSSVAKIAILPLQDLLHLDECARTNTPGNNNGNWCWKLKPGQLNKTYEEKLRELVKFYNRY